MQIKDIAQQLVCTENIVVKDIYTHAKVNALIVAHLMKKEQFWWILCHRKSLPYDAGLGIHRWFTLDIGSCIAFA